MLTDCRQQTLIQSHSAVTNLACNILWFCKSTHYWKPWFIPLSVWLVLISHTHRIRQGVLTTWRSRSWAICIGSNNTMYSYWVHNSMCQVNLLKHFMAGTSTVLHYATEVCPVKIQVDAPLVHKALRCGQLLTYWERTLIAQVSAALKNNSGFTSATNGDTEQCDTKVAVAVLILFFSFPDRNDQPPFPVRNYNRLPNGSQDTIQLTDHS